MPPSPHAPRGLVLSVALVAASMILVEILVTRIFSVLFFYHYSFFAISLIMSGLAFGGLLAARWNVRAMDEDAFRSLLANLAYVFSVGLLVAMAGILSSASLTSAMEDISIGAVILKAAAFLPGLAAAGAFLAAAFAREPAWINRLYAGDLLAAAAACLAAIFLMRMIPGPATLLIPAILAAGAGWIVGRRRRKSAAIGALLCAGAIGLLAAHRASDWKLLALRIEGPPPLIERWNEHSRIVVFPRDSDPRHSLNIVIDKTASTLIPNLDERQPGAPIPVQPWWSEGEIYLGYRLGRPIENAAIIGIGGGRDILGALGAGARHVDGYELNGIILDIAENALHPLRTVARWPEVSLIHDEARVGIGRSGKKYDVIQASMIDTWAATASGGFVLSENGLYTLDGWRGFLSSLTDSGVITMTRWFLQSQQVETQRLVALATAALMEIGVDDPSRHIILAGPDRQSLATIVVSKTPFTDAELARVWETCKAESMSLLALPGKETKAPVIKELLDPAQREAAIASSQFDLSPPTDARPYFFLLVRPRDVLKLGGKTTSDVFEITFNGIRVLVIMGGLSILFAAAVFALSAFALPSASASELDRRVHRRMGVYFLSIGLAYIFVQLGLHQRLILMLGHPTYALSVVLFSMLLGTGLGSAASLRLFRDGEFWKAWIAILALLAALAALFPALPLLERIESVGGRAAIAGALLAATGFALGFGFPLGVRLAAPSGEWAIQKMWAINGAASIAGSALAAITGVMWGCRATIIAGLAIYAVAALAGRSAERLRSSPDARRP